MPKEFEFITLEGLQAFKEESEAKNNGAYASKLSITQDATTGVITLKLFASDDTLLDTKTLDLETEKIIKSVSLNYAEKKLVFTLSDDSTINCDISDLIDTLEDKIETEETRAKDAERDLGNRITTIENDYLTTADKTELANDIEAEENRAKGVEKSIKDKIPTEATAQNQLADKEWVNRNGGKIDSVSIDGTPVEPDVNKNVNLPAYPTRVSLQINNVNNTSDMEKPVSAPQKEAIDASGHRIALEINSETYEIVAKLYDANDNLISTSNVIDLPLESVVVSGRYDAITKDVVLTLEGGSVIRFSVADLIYGLQSEITANNPLSSDLVSDTNNAHKFVSANEKAQITTNKNDIAGIKNGAEINNFDEAEKALEKKQNTIDADHKLSATLISETTNKQFISAEDKAQINSNKQAITNIKNGTSIENFDDVEKALADKQATIDSDHKLSANLIEENANKKFVSEAEKTTWNNKYDKPSGGIEDDLSDDVKASLSKADSAVQDENYVHTDNNYTDEDKEKLADLENYDDTEVKGLITDEADRATKQENKALHFKGAYDSDDGKTRQTWEVDLGTLEWTLTQGTGYWYWFTNFNGGQLYVDNTNPSYCIHPVYEATSVNALGGADNKVCFSSRNEIYVRTTSITEKPSGILQYKLATPLTTNDGVIAGESLLPLDANMANKIRQKVVDGLNILDINNGAYDGSNCWYTYIDFRENGQYYLTLNQNINRIVMYYSNDNEATWNRLFDVLNTYERQFEITNTSYKYIIYLYTSGSTAVNPSNYKTYQPMLIKGTNAYPHSDFNQKEHITNPHAEYLKKKWEDSINVFDTNIIQLGDIDGSQPTKFANATFGYVKAGTTFSYRFTKAFINQVILTSQPMPTSSDNLIKIIYEGMATGAKEYTFTLDSDGYLGFIFAKDDFSALTLDEIRQIDFCLSYSNEPYDPQEYNPREHITNDEATLLKQEEEKCRNLCPVSSKTINIVANQQNVITDVANLPAGTYNISITTSTSVDSSFQVKRTDTWTQIADANFNGNAVFTLSDTTSIAIYYYSGNNYSNIPVKIMLNEGSEAKPYTENYGEIVHMKDITPVLLWENSSPTSAFVGQTITTNQSLDNFKYVVIEYKINYSSGNGGQFEKIRMSNKNFYISSTAHTNTGIYARAFTITSATTIVISDGYYNASVDSTAIIPVAIYGTNIL